jgi:hypothetical protein
VFGGAVALLSSFNPFVGARRSWFTQPSRVFLDTVTFSGCQAASIRNIPDAAVGLFELTTMGGALGILHSDLFEDPMCTHKCEQNFDINHDQHVSFHQVVFSNNSVISAFPVQTAYQNSTLSSNSISAVAVGGSL